MNNVYFLKNPKIVPFSLDCKEKHENYIHGIIHKDLTSPVRGLVRGEEKKLLINEKRLIEVSKTLTFKKTSGNCFYLGPFINQFGHLIAQTFSRAWAYQEYVDEIDKVIILGRTSKDTLSNMPSYVLGIFEFFKIDLDKVLFITEPIQIENLILPQQSHGIGFREPWYENEYSRFYDDGRYIDENSPKKVFVSRRNYKLKGRLAGLDSIANVLKRNGYEEVFTERLTLEEQIKIYINATHIVAEEGSALHTLDLIPKINAKVFLISRRRGYATFKSLIERVCSDLTLFDDVYTIDSGEREANAISVSFSLVNLVSQLKQMNFIKNDSISHTKINESIIDDISSFYQVRSK